MSKSAADEGFNKRAFIGAMALFSGISLPLSGLANHVLGFEGLTVPHHAWMAAHNVMGILFAVFVIWHAYLNRHMLARHLHGLRQTGTGREARAALTIVGILLLLAVGHAFAAAAHH